MIARVSVSGTVSAKAIPYTVSGPTTPRQNCGLDQTALPHMVYVLLDIRAANRSLRVTGMGESKAPNRDTTSVVRPSSFDGP